MIARVELTPHQKCRTPHFKEFERSAAELNHFYWTFRSALQFTLPAMEKAKMVAEIIEGDVGQKLNIPAAKFVADVPGTLRTARHSFLVLSVTIFEEYLRGVLTSVLVKTWKRDRSYKVSFRPQDLPTEAALLDYLRDKAIQSTVEEVLGRSYRSRFDSVCALVKSCGATEPSLDKHLKDLAVAACEARNCIVHASGQLDVRAIDALAPFIHGLESGVALNIEEPILWKFLASLRDTARVIDVAVRPLGKKGARSPAG